MSETLEELMRSRFAENGDKFASLIYPSDILNLLDRRDAEILNLVRANVEVGCLNADLQDRVIRLEELLERCLEPVQFASECAAEDNSPDHRLLGEVKAALARQEE